MEGIMVLSGRSHGGKWKESWLYVEGVMVACKWKESWF